MKHVFLYCRVSHDEQVKAALSIPAQIAKLEKYCREKEYKIVKVFKDEGLTASNMKRKGLQDLLEDLQSNEIDLVVFTMLDRFTRLGKDYYKLIEVLDRHNVGWDAALEDYDTTTANGQLMLELKLAINHNELLRVGERVKVVFENKVKNGTVISGSTSLGYEVVDKKLSVIPHEANCVQFIFDEYEKRVSPRKVSDVVRLNFGIDITVARIKRMLRNKIYIGEYRDNKNFCEPIIEYDQFYRIQSLHPKYVKTNKKRVYLFAGIIKCSNCQSKLAGNTSIKSQRWEYKYYRCDKANKGNGCNCTQIISEKKLEKYLLENLSTIYKQWQFETKNISDRKQRKSNQSTLELAKIKKKLIKIKDLYLDDKIEKDEYIKSYTELQSKKELYEQSQEPTVYHNNSKKLETILSKDYRSLYTSLNADNKASFWRTLIECIEVDFENNKELKVLLTTEYK